MASANLFLLEFYGDISAYLYDIVAGFYPACVVLKGIHVLNDGIHEGVLYASIGQADLWTSDLLKSDSCPVFTILMLSKFLTACL